MCSVSSSRGVSKRRAQDATARRPQVWAIIVGVGSPAHPMLKATTSREAVRQATSAFGWFSRTAGWDRNHLLLLTDFGGSDDPGTVRSPAPNITPLKKNLDWAFREWLKPRVKPDDVIVFYFAGQARSIAPSDPSSLPENYLLPSDARSESLASSGWSLDRALDFYAKQGKYQIVCWLGTSFTIRAGARWGEWSELRHGCTEPRLAPSPCAVAGCDSMAGVRRHPDDRTG